MQTLTGKTIRLDFNPEDTGLQVMERVEDVEGIPRDQQRLIFGGKQVDKGRTLGSYGVRAGATLHLVIRSSGYHGGELCLRVDTGQSFEVPFRDTDTVWNVKERVEAAGGPAADAQRLKYNELELRNDKTLAEYKVDRGSTLQLIPRLRVSGV